MIKKNNLCAGLWTITKTRNNWVVMCRQEDKTTDRTMNVSALSSFYWVHRYLSWQDVKRHNQVTWLPCHGRLVSKWPLAFTDHCIKEDNQSEFVYMCIVLMNFQNHLQARVSESLCPGGNKVNKAIFSI